MPTQSLTLSGVQLKLDELYALSDPALQLEAEALQSDYQGWIAANFTLTTEQQTYLANLDAQFIEYAAFNSAFAMRNRMPMALAVLNPSASSKSAASKLVRTNNSMIVTQDPIGGITVTGSFDYEFEYV